jgi:tetratricopeptide (TPR) repeat protein
MSVYALENEWKTSFVDSNAFFINNYTTIIRDMMPQKMKLACYFPLFTKRKFSAFCRRSKKCATRGGRKIVSEKTNLIMDPNKKGAPKISDEERTKLAQQLDDEMADYLAKIEEKAKKGPGYIDGWKEDNWEQEMESHPFFASNEALLSDAAKGELSPLMEGLQLLKYSPDENTPDDLAKNYKDDGNFQFKVKKYRLAVAAYTEGLRCKCEDTLVNVQLLSNRAAAQFHLGNYRSSFNDCVYATKLKPDHLKAVKRGAFCLQSLKRHDDCVAWTTKAIELDPNDEEMKEMLIKEKAEAKDAERNNRREAVRKKKQSKDDAKLVKALKSRNITLQGCNLKSANVDDEDQVSAVVETLKRSLPTTLQKRVRFSPEDGQTLVWPVLFMYPEYGETDLIEEFEEAGQHFSDHLQAMFGHGIERPVWDIQNKYVPERLKIYFEDRLTDPDKVALVPLQDINCTLGQVLSDPRFEVIDGVPTFIVLVDKSPYETVMIKTYLHPHLK